MRISDWSSDVCSSDLHRPEKPMKCPTCDNVNLAMTDRQGIEIDYCPQCRGIWLDRGELDRPIDRAEQAAPAMPPAMPPAPPPSRDDPSRRDARPHGYTLAEAAGRERSWQPVSISVVPGSR